MEDSCYVFNLRFFNLRFEVFWVKIEAFNDGIFPILENVRVRAPIHDDLS